MSIYLSLSLSVSVYFPAPLYETQCEYVEATLSEFLAWISQQDDPAVGAFHDYPLSDYWAYADYKYIAKLFQDEESMFEVILM